MYKDSTNCFTLLMALGHILFLHQLICQLSKHFSISWCCCKASQRGEEGSDFRTSALILELELRVTFTKSTNPSDLFHGSTGQTLKGLLS